MTHSYVKWLIHMSYGSFIGHMTHYLKNDSFIYDMTHSYVTWLNHMWPDSFIYDMTHPYATWLIHIWHDSFLLHFWIMNFSTFISDTTHSYVTWLIHMWHKSFLFHLRIMNLSTFVWHLNMNLSSSICHSSICDMTHSHVTWSQTSPYSNVSVHIMSRIHVWHNSFIWHLNVNLSSFFCHTFMCDITHSYVTCGTWTSPSRAVYAASLCALALPRLPLEYKYIYIYMCLYICAYTSI